MATNREEQKQLETLLLRSQRFEGIGKLAGGIAHDLNNLLAPIQMSAELLARKVSEPQLLHFIEVIKGSTQQAHDVIRKLSHFSSFSSDAEPRSLKLEAFLKDFTQSQEEALPENIQLRVEISEDFPEVKLDPRHLFQALTHLVANARDAMEEGGEIRIRVRRKSILGVGTVGTKTIPSGEFSVIEVQDTGKGIDPSEIEKVFDPFYSTKPKEDASRGLGLPLVHGMVSTAGGFVELDSEPGQGARFSLYFPLPNSVP